MNGITSDQNNSAMSICGESDDSVPLSGKCPTGIRQVSRLYSLGKEDLWMK